MPSAGDILYLYDRGGHMGQKNWIMVVARLSHLTERSTSHQGASTMLLQPEEGGSVFRITAGGLYLLSAVPLPLSRWCLIMIVQIPYLPQSAKPGQWSMERMMT